MTSNSQYKLFGHQRVKKITDNWLNSGEFPTPMLLIGKEGVGKATFAIELTKKILCEEKTQQKPCNSCFSCKRIENFKHPDVWFILPDKLDRGKMGEDGWIRTKEYHTQLKISINNIRWLERELTKPPQYSHKRVVIILNGENLTEEAQNSLLKTLEEIHGRNLILIISSFPGSLFLTVVSRLRSLKFQSLNEVEFSQVLMNYYPHLDELSLRLHFNLSDGSPGIARKLIENNMIELRDLILDTWLQKGPETVLDILVSLDVSQEFLYHFLYLLSSITRDLIFAKLGMDNILNFDRKELIHTLARDLKDWMVRDLLKNFEFVEMGYKSNVNPKALIFGYFMTFLEPTFLDSLRVFDF